MAADAHIPRSFLFLQGLSTPYFRNLGRAISARGHRVQRINICGGDSLFWPKSGSVAFRGHFEEWRGFIGSFLHERGITDVVLFGDCRPYHRVAIEVARSRGIEVHVFEEGYFRPDWITLEKQGSNAFSGLPRDPKWYLAAAAALEDQPVEHVGGGVPRRIFWEFLSQCATVALSPRFPHYRRHRVNHPTVEGLGFFWRFLKRPFEQRYAAGLSEFLLADKRKFFLLPLQLDTDYQIRSHSSFRNMEEVIDRVMTSFAARAPAQALLLIKVHPLDNGLSNFRRRTNDMARQLGLVGRVFVMDGGHLPTLLERSQGVVTVNSTTGLQALHHNCRLKVLGTALFDMPGLTFRGPLDAFWTDRSKPDPALYRAFRSVVLAATQVNGSFFTKPGRHLGIEGVLQRLRIEPVAQVVAGHGMLPAAVRGEAAGGKAVGAVGTVRAA